jgi:HEAT repeat protein
LQDPSKAVRLVAVEWLGGDGSGWDSPDKLDMLLGQMSGNDRDLIAAAADSLRRTPSEPFGRQIADAMDGASPAGQEALLELLAARSCDGQVGVVIRYACESKNPRVRLAAVRALADLAGPEELPELFAIYLEEDSSAVRQAARKALADRIAEDREAREAVVAMFLPEAGDRNHPLVRLAEEAGEPGKRRLLELLPHLGGEDSLRAVRAAVDSEAPDLRDTAVRALADWPDPEAASQLIEIARESESKLHRTLALRAYIRLVAEPSATAAPETVEKLRAALELTEDPATQRLALSALGRLRDRDALRLVAENLDGPNREEAAAAAVNILLPTDGRRGIRGRLACRVADRVLDVSQNETLLKRLRAYRPQLDSLNLAIDQPAEATCAHEGDRVASLAVDGLIRQDSAWFGEKWPCSLTVDLEESQTIDVVRPVFYWDGVRHYQYTIEVSTDGESWTQVVDASTTEEPAEMTGDVHEIELVEARYVRLNVLKNSANPAVHVVELEVYAPGGHPDRYPGPRPVRAEPANPLPEPDENGFIPLFNGRDLRGWIGSTDGYEVRDGNLVCRPKVGRNLFFEHPFDDFELHFEFRLTPGANNGLAIRSPLHGNPAYVGMELQILDNAHPKYARLKPYQYHGSIYGVVPAERGALKPAGQWNRQVVRAVGPKITVEVNGRKIVDADLSEITETADGRGRKGHPGILRSDGHIGFLGHGDEVAFRNIRIRPIDRDQESQEKKP